MIHDHGYKPAPQFRHTRSRAGKRTLFMGFELEIETDTCDGCRKSSCETCLTSENSDDLADEVQKRFKDNGGPIVYCKEDGSLESGFEIVSHPLSWGWIKAHKAKIEALLKFLVKKGARSHDPGSCGLHVHVGRNTLTQGALGRLVRFVFDNPELIESICRRKRHNLNEWAQVRFRNYDDYESKDYVIREASKVGYKDLDRNLALNTLPSKTVEFRLFRGTLNPKSFMRSLEFAHAAVTFAKGAEALTREAFAAFVAANSGEYPNLHEFMLSPKGRAETDRAAVAA